LSRELEPGGCPSSGCSSMVVAVEVRVKGGADVVTAGVGGGGGGGGEVGGVVASGAGSLSLSDSVSVLSGSATRKCFAADVVSYVSMVCLDRRSPVNCKWCV
jgi:hypothetical protein